jgi:hypothetical protein
MGLQSAVVSPTKVDNTELKPGTTKNHAVQMPKFQGYPTFENLYEEREFMKGRLVLAFRIFAKFGYDEGVAGHITLRVCTTHDSI